jgi:hypothetical protein
VTEHDDFDRQFVTVTSREPEQLERSDECQVKKYSAMAQLHLCSQAGESPAEPIRMTFSAPTP